VSAGRIWRARRSRHAAFGAAPGTCPRCGLELEPAGDLRRYCSSACRKDIARLPVAERAARRDAAPPGTCVGCGAPIDPAGRWRCPHWKRSPQLWRMRRAAGGPVRFTDDAWAWLGAKLGLPADDERLPAIALELAKAGRLHVLVSEAGTPIAAAKVARETPAG
jgi:hypothetical protein